MLKDNKGQDMKCDKCAREKNIYFLYGNHYRICEICFPDYEKKIDAFLADYFQPERSKREDDKIIDCVKCKQHHYKSSKCLVEAVL